MRASFWICWTTWIASISSDGDTITTLDAERLLHDVVEALVQFGIDRL